MEINEDDENDIIKAYIKIDYPENKKEKIYEIDNSKKILTLFNFESNTHSETSFLFEFDKIFTNNDSNSYIYEEISLNCIKEYLQGISFSFISFGETISNKFYLLYGNLRKDISNINNYGLAIRFLNNLINYKNKTNIKWSCFLVYEDNLIDLYDKCDDININVDTFLKNAYKIKDDQKIVEKIKKNSFVDDGNDAKEIISLMNKIANLLIKFEEEGNNLYSLSHICLVVYLLDNKEKIISTVSFIRLNGNEHLYDLNMKKRNIKNNLNKSPINNSINFDTIKNSIEIKNTYDNIINCVKRNKYINNIINKKMNQKEYLDKPKQLEKIEKMSKLEIVMYRICLGENISNIKFRIIGNIKPITGFYKTTRDTLLFVSKFTEIFKKENLIKRNSLNQEIIFNLNYKIDSQKKKIDDLMKIISKKDEKINMLTKTYNKQINTLKKCLDFKGDINILISGDTNTEEFNFVKNIKNSNIIIKRQESEIKILMEKLEKVNNELIKYKNIYKIKENDKTMVNYFLNSQNIKDGINKKNEIFEKADNYMLNNLKKELIDLKNKINIKDKIIEELKKDLEVKNNILCNLPKSLELSVNKKKQEEIEINDTYVMMKNEIKKFKINEQKINESLKLKYDTILLEKKNTIYNLEHKLEGIEENYKSEINMLNKELVRLYEILLYFTTNYQNIFCSEKHFKDNNSLKIKKIEFDEIVKNIDKDINFFNFYGLHQELEKQNKTKESIIKSLHIEKIYKELKNPNQNENSQENKKEKIDTYENIDQNQKSILNEKDNIISKLNHKILKMANYISEQSKINNNNTIIINSQKRTIDKMNNDTIIYNNLLKRKIQKKVKTKIPQYNSNSHLALYKKILQRNNSSIKSLDKSVKKNKFIKDYFDSFCKNYKSINIGSTRSNDKELKDSTDLTKSPSCTNRFNSPEKVFVLKNDKRPCSSYKNKINNYNFSRIKKY